MKAVVQANYGSLDNLALRDVAKPPVGEDDVLVRVRAASVHPDVWHGGGVGSLALQIAKAYGAHVTAVDGTSKLGMLRSLGADHVVDYTQEDFTRNGHRYDLGAEGAPRSREDHTRHRSHLPARRVPAALRHMIEDDTRGKGHHHTVMSASSWSSDVDEAPCER